MRLIDADALKALFDEQYDTAFMQMHTRDNIEHWNGVCAGVNWGRNTMAEAPTVDAVPVVHGRWETHNQIDSVFYCSVCKLNVSGFERRWLNYCPSCGVRMDGDPHA
jgi:hypothetical protein